MPLIPLAKSARLRAGQYPMVTARASIARVDTGARQRRAPPMLRRVMRARLSFHLAAAKRPAQRRAARAWRLPAGCACAIYQVNYSRRPDVVIAPCGRHDRHASAPCGLASRISGSDPSRAGQLPFGSGPSFAAQRRWQACADNGWVSRRCERVHARDGSPPGHAAVASARSQSAFPRARPRSRVCAAPAISLRERAGRRPFRPASACRRPPELRLPLSHRQA